MCGCVTLNLSRPLPSVCVQEACPWEGLERGVSVRREQPGLLSFSGSSLCKASPPSDLVNTAFLGPLPVQALPPGPPTTG